MKFAIRKFSVLNLEKIQFFLHTNIIMNWSNLDKCTLILVLGCCQHLLWIVWKLFIFYTPSLWQWVNIPLLEFQISLNIYALIILILLIIPCIKLKKKQWAEDYLPYIILTVFVAMFIRDGYLIGIFSPATLCGYICISGIGFLLFERKIVYPPLLLATITLLSLALLTIFEALPYAPMFSDSLLHDYPFKSVFWIVSMAYFIIPIIFASLILGEIILIQWRHRESLIKKLSQTDPLTGLFNRRSFNEKLQLIHRSKAEYAIIILDLDHFKNINDEYGHQCGDEVLEHVAHTLTHCIRPSDIVARYGGEEFIMVLNDTEITQATAIAERCRLAIQDLHIQSRAEESISLTASFGLAMSSYTYESEKIIHFADTALYGSKQQGRNQIQIYPTDFSTSS